jgi:hypothetical protein
MTVFVTWLMRTIGTGGCAFLGLWIYDWGIPGASRIPYLSGIPIIGDLTTGRAHSYAADQVKIATAQAKAQCDALLEKTVSTFQYEALAAQRDEESRQRLAAEVAAANAAIRAADALKGKQAAEDRIEALLKEAEADPELTRPNAKDFQWTPKR